LIKLLKAADRAAIPWKNGGGVTRDVIVSPAGATLENFDWRISIAEIASGVFRSSHSASITGAGTSPAAASGAFSSAR